MIELALRAFDQREGLLLEGKSMWVGHVKGISSKLTHFT